MIWQRMVEVSRIRKCKGTFFIYYRNHVSIFLSLRLVCRGSSWSKVAQVSLSLASSFRGTWGIPKPAERHQFSSVALVWTKAKKYLSWEVSRSPSWLTKLLNLQGEPATLKKKLILPPHSLILFLWSIPGAFGLIQSKHSTLSSWGP